jgi:large subunit ribosomal protein L18
MTISRAIKKQRSKSKLTGKYPCVVVYRSNKNISAQVYDPASGNTLFSSNSNDIKKGTKTEKAVQVGKKIATKIKDLKIEKVVFNRNGYIYKGRIKAVADAIREENIAI